MIILEEHTVDEEHSEIHWQSSALSEVDLIAWYMEIIKSYFAAHTVLQMSKIDGNVKNLSLNSNSQAL